MALPKPRTRDGRCLPAEIYIPLVDSLYRDGRTLLVGSIFAVGSVLLTYSKTAEPLLLTCALALAAVAGVRGLSMRAYNRVRAAIVSHATARRWEYIYVAGAAASVALLGLWCYVAFARTDDSFTQLVSFTMTMAYVIGIFGRNFGSARFVIVQILSAGTPMVAALLLYGDVYHWLFAGLLLPVFMAVKFVAERLRLTLLDAVIATRDMSQLAERFDTALNNMPHGLCMFDAQGHVVVANHRMLEILGLPRDFQAKGVPAHRLARACIKAGTVDVLDAKRLARNFERRLSGADGSELTLETFDGRTLEITLQPMERGGIVVLVQDISDRKLAEARINHLARFDALTGLPNRMVLRDRMHQALAQCRQGAPYAIHFIDLDQFKQVNDTLGHSRGDMLLQTVADRLRGIVRDTDVVARFGGDEFVLLQVPAASLSEASTLARRIVKDLGRPYTVDGHEVVIGASVGIAYSPRDGEDIDELLKNADMALYRAKAENRRTWRFFKPEMEVDAQSRRSLELDLRGALEADAFQVHFQPILDLRTNRIAVCEALVRWPHPTRGMVSPAEFIPVAEEMGLIVELGRRILRMACQECRRWPGDIPVAVNLSPLQFARGNLPAIVRETLAGTGLPANRLEVEITETTLLQNTSSTRAALQHLQALGVKISLDDFGTGYSSLSYLHAFPLHKVKIDRSFLHGLGASDRTLTLLRGVARLSTELGIRVAVEGIETQEQLELILRDGLVDEAQGYLFGVPMPGSELRKLLYAMPQQVERVA